MKMVPSQKIAIPGLAIKPNMDEIRKVPSPNNKVVTKFTSTNYSIRSIVHEIIDFSHPPIHPSIEYNCSSTGVYGTRE